MLIQSCVEPLSTMKSTDLFLLYFPILTCLNFTYSQYTCDEDVYGKPAVKDCFDLYNDLPSERISEDVLVDATRAFVEPKFLQPTRFCPVRNPFSVQMVQLPKIWRQGTCRCALMSVADATGTVQQPISIDKWRTVLNAFIDNVDSCVLHSNGAGGVRFANMEKPDAKVVYVYAQGSFFEELINAYMTSYDQGIDPGCPVAILDNATATNISLAASRPSYSVESS